MTMMGRILILLMLGGGFLSWYGYEEYTVGQGASAEAEAVELVDLEAGNVPDNNHLRIGPHLRVYGGSVFQYEKDRNRSGGPQGGDKVEYTYYPIISFEHSFVLQLLDLEEKYGDLERVPDEEWPNDIGEVAVLVKSKKFKTVNQIPEEMKDEAHIQGLVINSIDDFSSEELRLLRQSFPSANFNTVLILEEDRKPSSIVTALTEIAGGVGLILLGIFGFAKDRVA
jgi:hypothetical protein